MTLLLSVWSALSESFVKISRGLSVNLSKPVFMPFLYDSIEEFY